MPRWIGVDYGTRRIGLAISDPAETIASPAAVLDGTGSPSGDARLVCEWAQQQDSGGFVVGLPLNMNGSEGPQAVLCKGFAQMLQEATGLPVRLWDERLSSFQAEAYLDAAGVPASRRQRRRDALAAQVILQSFLDARGTEPEPPPGR